MRQKSAFFWLTKNLYLSFFLPGPMSLRKGTYEVGSKVWDRGWVLGVPGHACPIKNGLSVASVRNIFGFLQNQQFKLDIPSAKCKP